MSFYVTICLVGATSAALCCTIPLCTDAGSEYCRTTADAPPPFFFVVAPILCKIHMIRVCLLLLLQQTECAQVCALASPNTVLSELNPPRIIL